jgi:energy-converting hydrogenase A subunit R
VLVAIDCEGPLTRNDNALELSRHFIPHGDILFTQLSRYDDILAFMIKRPGYRAGNTLKLICPFFRAYRVRNQDIADFSERHILIMPGADSLIQWIKENAQGIIVSTSYTQYVHAFCEAIGFSPKNTYSTQIDLDLFDPPQDEYERIKEMAEKIIALPALNWPPSVRSIEELEPSHIINFGIIDEIMTKDLGRMSFGKYLRWIKPIGGVEKAKAVKKSYENAEIHLSDVIYIGDSITDVDALRMVKEGGGMAVSFNGNRYAIEAAEIACCAFHSDILAFICEVFLKGGKEGVFEMIHQWKRGGDAVSELLSHSSPGEALMEKEALYPSSIEAITRERSPEIIKKSEMLRGALRGEEIGRLG